MRSSSQMLRLLLHMAAGNPLLGGVILGVTGGRIRLRATQHDCTIISPAVDPQQLVPWVDLEASLLAGRRIEKPGLLREKRHQILVLQRAHDLDAQAAQYIAEWLDASPLHERPPVLAVVDDHAADVPHWLDCRLAFRLLWEDHAEPELTWALPCSHVSSAEPHDIDQLDEALLRSITVAAAANGLKDPRYDIMAAAAAYSRAVASNRPVHREDMEWAIRWVLDPRAQTNQRQKPPTGHEGSLAAAKGEGHPADSTGRSTTVPPTTSHASGEPRNEADDAWQEMTAQPAASHDNAGSIVSPTGNLMGESVQFAPVAPMPETQRLPPLHLSSRKPTSPPGAGRTVGRYGDALPHKAGRPGRRFVNSSSYARIDLAATLRAAVPWQRLRAHEGLQNGHQRGRRIRVYPQDLKYRQRQRRPGTTYFILLDASASMWSRHLAQAKRVALQLTEQAYRSRSRIAVIAIRGLEPELIVSPGRCYNEAYTHILGLEVGGSTPLVPALQLTLSLLNDSCADDHALVYILTDGRGQSQATDDMVNSIGQSLVNAGAEITVIGTVSPGQDRAARRLANALHGAYQSARHHNKRN